MAKNSRKRIEAHAPAEVGMNFVDAIRLAHAVGYKQCCKFRARKREVVRF